MLPTLAYECSEFLLESGGKPLLKNLPKRSDGFVRVKVRRRPPKDETGNDDYSFYNYPYNRYYLIGQDGITRSI